jgi:hypothetical protein
MQRFVAGLRPLGLGFLGVFLALLLWHAWTDHVAFHQIVAFVNQHAATIQQLAPAPPAK